jgi:hypothetical protein
MMGKLKHGAARRGAHSPEFKAWRAMRRRCLDPNFIVFENYGGRGIRICDRWADFNTFRADMGPKPSPDHSLDRINPDGDYAPTNCRWATRSEQNLNQRPRRPAAACRRGHLFTGENTYTDKRGNRSCKRCRAASATRTRQKEKAHA